MATSRIFINLGHPLVLESRSAIRRHLVRRIEEFAEENGLELHYSRVDIEYLVENFEGHVWFPS